MLAYIILIAAAIVAVVIIAKIVERFEDDQ